MLDYVYLERELERLKVKKENIGIIRNEVERAAVLYRRYGVNLKNMSFLFVVRKNGEIKHIHLFDKNELPIESLEGSFDTLNELLECSDRSIDKYISITFVDETGKLCIILSSKKELQNVVCKKIKQITYGLTDSISFVDIDILQSDIKGIEADVLKGAVRYSFDKRVDYKTKDMYCYVLGYS